MYDLPDLGEPQHVDTKPEIMGIEPAPARTYNLTGLGFRCLRLRLGLTVAEMADYMGYTDKAIYKIEYQPARTVSATPARYIGYLLEESEYWVPRMSPSPTVYKSGYRTLSNGLLVPESWWAALVGGNHPSATPGLPPLVAEDCQA